MSPHKTQVYDGPPRLAPALVDQIAQKTPSRPFIWAPRTSNPADGWVDISFGTFANAINRTAHALLKDLGPAPEGTFPTIAYIGPNDIRYFLYMFGAIKAGYKALFVSPRNTEEGQLSLFKATDCNTLYYSTNFKALIQPWLAKREMRAIESRGADELLDPETVTPIPYTTDFEKGQWLPFVVLHTSGSTGIPKPIVVRLGSPALIDRLQQLPLLNGFEFFSTGWSKLSSKSFCPYPLFHAAGLIVNVFMSIYGDLSMCMGIPDKPLTTALVLECLAHSGCDSAMLPPSIIQDMGQTAEGLAALKKVGVLGTGGGAIGKDMGDKLVKEGVKLLNFISSTECMPYPFYLQNNYDNWEYFIFNEGVFGVEWRPFSEEGNIYKMVVVRKDKEPGFQPCFYTFPDTDEFDTGDLYTPHPTLPNHWKHCGRADTVIVFSNGEKLNPVTIEETVEAHLSIKGAVVFGANQFQPGILIEPAESPNGPEEASRFIDSIWPLIQEANELTVKHGRISRQMVGLTSPDKPFPRAGKGSIQRGMALKLYNGEINALYNQVSGKRSSGEAKLDLSSEKALAKSMSQSFQSSLDLPEIDPSTDFFAAGLDSLQVINIGRLLSSGLEEAGVNPELATVENGDIYAHPTLESLAAYLYSRLNSKQTNGHGPKSEDDIARSILAKYIKEMPISASNKPKSSAQGQVVILTGSTGSLGSYMLDILMQTPSVAKVVCLNRGDDGGRQKQLKVHDERGLSTDFSKAEFYRADLSQYDLGLETAIYADLLSQADRIVHNAWPVNFNLEVTSFEPYIHGVRNLVDFASRCTKQVSVVFISSIGTVIGWNKAEPVPEISLPDMAMAGAGYGRSKLVSSLILEEASRKSGVPAATIRVGQIAGPLGDKGEWGRQEWLPSIILSSATVGALPENFGPMTSVAWMPVEGVARTVLEVSGATDTTTEDPSGYYNLVNPRETTWEALSASVVKFFKDRGTELRVVPLAEWVQLVEQETDISKNPAAKLLGTYRGWLAAGPDAPNVVLSVERTKQASKTLREMEAVSPELMRHWCEQWYA